MNILIIGQNTKLASVLNKITDKLYMVVDTTDPDYRSYKENNLYNLLSSRVDFTKVSNVFQRSKEINIWVRQYDIDVIFTNEKNSMIAARISSYMLKKKPILISTSHNSYAWLHSKKVFFFSKLINYTTDGYICLASFVYKQLIDNKLPSNKLLLLPNVIEYGLFEKKKTYSIQDSIVRIVYTAVVYDGKAQSDLIRAAEMLRAKNIKFQIDFYGNTASNGTEYQKFCNELIEQLKLSESISFKGKIENSELRKNLPSYDIYVCPSHMEMSPFNILEAKASGLPIIATRVGGIPDLIVDGIDGVLVRPSNAEELATAIVELVNNEGKREFLGRNASLEVAESAQRAPIKISSFLNSLK